MKTVATVTNYICNKGLKKYCHLSNIIIVYGEANVSQKKPQPVQEVQVKACGIYREKESKCWKIMFKKLRAVT